MLLPDNINPNDCIYYNAAFVLQELSFWEKRKILDLYQDISQKKEMNFFIFLLCLDWLYLINCIQMKNDEISKCF